ncbi:MAG TPA: secondary thiamine-phosphate synthase enzyme YjbQ [bacterium]|jgi:secondary thiamine-phosphate synthase enzyme|nr:YjbQ family protein [Myxococcales bacterium]OQA60239.1 MAG: hypothetical protein BWY40_01048 [bacterium ADurb.Bin270]HPW44808.1 secondary thiamine-phosphate synthase enzyme YjbQ [bacterium]HQC50250.1 secondary thiamine-phosphate synthase enzyme YjbQ [bacterium]HQG13091.1 secondary thiamine-phosphate synthase enzyme YjbQ [bacterium]
MTGFQSEILIDSSSDIQFIDITDRVNDALRRSGVKDGLVVIFSNHTTASVRITENCKRLQMDMINYLKDAVPKAAYRHDEHTVDNRQNARMHIMSLFMNASETIPVKDGEMILGSWQSIFFVELDGPRDSRKVIVKILGESR